ncbi:Hsp70 family protein [Catenulispora pinisilvae]|uniref:Hsp70 family protein n=1 Tax=Catenulispora pinisilvae TaxID=2705253 RepID=UPI0018920E69|nr:Hsp70 family protein [Catenulispora pinisilvae]
METELHRVVGIDLGTTYSAVAAYDKDDYSSKILADPERVGSAAAAMPSVVRLDAAAGVLMIGHDAKDAIAGPGGPSVDTIVEIKREMGVLFTEELLEKYGAVGIFQKKDPVKARLGGSWLRPQEISALVLMKIKRIAEQTLGGEIHDAVVTVPAYFKEGQKRATEEAALLAGLYPRQLIPEPTAAAIAYGVDRADPEKQVYLVFDLGGGTFDVSIIETRDAEIEVIATAGDQRLGGGDFDDKIVSWIVRKLGGDLPAGFDRLRVKAAAEAAKRELSLRATTSIDLGDDLPVLELDRATFEDEIKLLLDRSLHQVGEALQDAQKKKGVNRSDINAVLLVGGSTRIPRIRQMLLDYFEQDAGFVRADANPDTLVARGAAIQAHRFAPSEAFDIKTSANAEPSGEDQDYAITLITEHTLGVGVEGGIFDPLIERGTKIPARRTKSYTNGPKAGKIKVPIYQGESEYVYEDMLIGDIHLDDIDPQPANHHTFDITFMLDVNGLLGVQVRHVNAGQEYEATFDQSTTIGEVDELEQSHLGLLKLFAEGPSPAAPAPAAAPPEFAIPAPVAWTPDPDSAPASSAASSSAPVSVPEPDLSTVPVEFLRTVQRVLRSVQDGRATAVLGQALADFLTAVAAGADTASLNQLADRLEDADDSGPR